MGLTRSRARWATFVVGAMGLLGRLAAYGGANPFARSLGGVPHGASHGKPAPPMDRFPWEATVFLHPLVTMGPVGLGVTDGLHAWYTWGRWDEGPFEASHPW